MVIETTDNAAAGGWTRRLNATITHLSSPVVGVSRLKKFSIVQPLGCYVYQQLLS